jgi:hypothetical protein
MNKFINPILAATNTNSSGVKTNANTANTNSSSNSNSNSGSGDPSESYIIPPKISNPVGEESLLAVGNRFISFLLAMIVIAAVVVIIVAGFRMVVGSGNEAEIKKAKKAIIYAIAGITVALASFAIVQIIQNFLAK